MDFSIFCRLEGTADTSVAPCQDSPEMVLAKFIESRSSDRPTPTAIARGGGEGWETGSEARACDLAVEAMDRRIDALRGGIGRRPSEGRRRGCRKR